nr:reverse transcriptase domain-containing protein [Tanacetum cinerariifolium]
MTDNRTMAEMLRAPTEGCAEAIIVPPILAEQFELKHSLINMMTLEQFFGLEKDNPDDHIRWFNKITSTIKYKDVPTSVIKLILFPFSLAGLDTFYNALNPADQDSLNVAAGGNLLEKSPQDALTIIENKSKVRNSRSNPIASLVNACDNHSSSELAKLTQAVNQQTSAVTTAMTAMLKQFQSNPPPAQVKAVEEICVTYGGVANQMRPPGFAQPNVQNNQNQFGQPQGFNHGTNFNQEQPYQATAQSKQNFHLNELEKIKRMNDVSLKAMQNQIDMMNTASTSGSGTLLGNTIANPKGELKSITTRSGLATDGPTVPNPPKFVNPEEDEYVEETYMDPDLAEYTIKVPPPPFSMLKYQKMLKTLLSNKEKLQELANTPLNENCSAVILKKSPEKLRDHGKFLIPCGFSELKCKALADLGASINLMPLSVWKNLGLPDLIPTRMTLELVKCAIWTLDEIARDVFVPVGKFTFPADFVVVDYESDPRVPLILGRPFLRTARALIDVHGEEMILRDEDERLTLNMKHDTASYSNHPHKDSVNLINIFNISNIDSFNDIHPHFDDDPLSGSTTYSANSLLEEFTDGLALITYAPDYDDNRTCDIESDIREIEILLYQGKDFDFKDSIDQSDLANLDDLFVDPTPEMFTDKQPPDYLNPPRFDVYPDDFLEIESDAVNFDDDSFDSKGEKIKETELLIDQLDLPCDILSEYDSFNS